jgi:hypothetical protein
LLLVTSNGAARFALLADARLASARAGLKLRTGSYGVIRATAAGLALERWDERP